jgi:cell division protein FtsI/penicillin-binding protein 2
MNEQAPRTTIMGIGFSVFAFLLVMQIFRVQHDPVLIESTRKLTQHYSWLMLVHEGERGRIYDVNGHLLAGSKTVYGLGVDLIVPPSQGRNPDTIANTLMYYFGEEYPIDEESLREGAAKDYDDQLPGHMYHEYSILKDIPQEKIDELEQLQALYAKRLDEYLDEATTKKEREKASELPGLGGLTWVPHLQRFYPENTLASNVIGFTSYLNEDDNGGKYGVEGYYDSKLVVDDQVNFLALPLYAEHEVEDIPIGQSLILTIDANIQGEVERILDEAVKENNASSGAIIVMDPKTGEIMAMAANPRINPNEYWNSSEALNTNIADERGGSIDNQFNKAIMDTYEPGSVIKVITMAIALQKDAVQVDTIYDDTGEITIGDNRVTNWNLRGNGKLDMAGCLKKSSNVCLAWVNTQTGADDYYEGLHEFGFDRRTNIDLAGEALYPLNEPGTASWTPSDLGRQAYGHGISVTPIQMITFISAIPNGGRIMAPHVLKAIVKDGVQYDNTPQLLANPISEEVAAAVNEMLIIPESQEIAETWLGYIEGYTMCGKTGTALKLELNDDGILVYSNNRTNTTFVGWGPAEDAEFIIYVWIDTPYPKTYASLVAAPIYKEVAEFLLSYLKIPPDNVRLQLQD